MSNDNYIYVNMHAESALDFQDDFQEIENVKEARNSQRGIYTNSVSALIPYELMKLEADKDLVLDMIWITDITVNNLLELMKVIQKFLACERSIHILHLDNDTESCIQEKCVQKGYYVMKEDFVLHISTNSNVTYASCTTYVEEIDNMFTKKLRKSLKACIDDRGDQAIHPSGAVYLKKYINMKRMLIEGNEAFLCYCIYKIAVSLVNENIIEMDCAKNRDISLFFHTINGAYIGGVLSALLQMNFIYLDHLGPINAIRKQNFENNIRMAKRYIVVADVICTTSEIGRAETLIEFNGGSVLCRVCFADVKTVLKQDRKQISCININAENNFLDYTIQTELCKNCKEMEERKAKYEKDRNNNTF